MTDTALACIILAAGRGTRMKSDKAKVMHEIAGRPMISHLLETVESLAPSEVVVVTAPWMDELREEVAPHKTAAQTEQKGTGDAVAAGLKALEGFEGNILILLGDMPLLRKETLQDLIAKKEAHNAQDLSILGVDLTPTPPFGRLIADGDILLDIAEDKDCTEEQRQITLCNTGAFCIDAGELRTWLPQLKNENAQGEYYFTDIPKIAAENGAKTYICITTDQNEIAGANNRIDLAKLEEIVQNGLRAKAMEGGATLIDPSSVTFSYDTQLGQDIIIEPNVFFGKNVTIKDNVHIKAFSHIEGAMIKTDAVIGPFARLRPGTEVGEGSKIGNFVELKNAKLEAGVKAGHLAYIGDAEVGEGTNYSCGAITANYDGFSKSKTIIGKDVMVGSNVNLVAPVTIEDGAYIAAGSTITSTVEKDALAINRGKTRLFAGWAASNRKKNAKK